MRYFFVGLLFFSFWLQSQPHFVLIGPPGSGKGTFSSYMTTTHDYCQICPGDILRAHIRDETDLGREIKPIVERGDYIDDSILVNLHMHLLITFLRRNS